MSKETIVKWALWLESTLKSIEQVFKENSDQSFCSKSKDSAS